MGHLSGHLSQDKKNGTFVPKKQDICPKNAGHLSGQSSPEIRDIDNIYMTLDIIYIYINNICVRAREDSKLKNELERLGYNFDTSLLEKVPEESKINIMLIMYAINEIYERKL